MVILYMAISEDGFIAGLNDETHWSDEEWLAFREFTKSCDVILMGRRTFQIMQKQDEFVEGPHYIVTTDDPSFETGTFEKRSIHQKGDMPKGNKVGIIGGGDLNGNLAKLGVIDEIILDSEAVKLGKGIKLFGHYDVKPKLQLVDSKRLGHKTVQNHYKVVGRE